MGRSLLFVSSVQKEFAAERATIRDFIRGDALLQRYFDVFLFEDLPASDRRADNVYLSEVDGCGVYVGLFGDEYGNEDAEGKSPTEWEFDRATEKGKPRLIFVKGKYDKSKHAKMRKLIRMAGSQLIRRRFSEIPDLTAALYASLVEHLERVGELRTLPFDASACPRAKINDISQNKITWFLESAKRERNYALAVRTGRNKVLAHLNLLDDGQPTHAAILLFGGNPQRFLPTSEIKCAHFHGTEIRKPIPSYQIFKGTAFELIDQSVDFVLSKIARSVGTREQGPQAPVEYELPKQAVAEAIVNAVAHRDYTSNASVQVMLFADRLEVWNPGELPFGLTPEKLRLPHPSIPRNPLIAESLYLTHYIEKAGTGTLDMIARCLEASLPEPDFHQDGGQWVVTLWRDWLTYEVLEEYNLNERQRQVIDLLKIHGNITNSIYQGKFSVAKRTASLDLSGLVAVGLVEKVGTTGKGVHYRLSKGAPKGQKGQ
jgi:ATP-dependent DNA helicase RecG